MKPWTISLRYLNFMIIFVGVLSSMLLGLMLWLAIHDDSDWAKFALQHHCLEVMSYPEPLPLMHRAYLCDDGITYVKAD